jgi:hypothetical protein
VWSLAEVNFYIVDGFVGSMDTELQLMRLEINSVYHRGRSSATGDPCGALFVAFDLR